MKHYEELTGGEGRRIFYRAERFKASTLMQDSTPVVDIHNKSYSLFDLSMSGLSFDCENDICWLDEMQTEQPFSLKLGADEIFSGQGRIRRIEPVQSGQKIALEISNGYLDVQEILRKHDEISLQNTLAEGMKDYSALVPDDYKNLVSDAIFLIRSAKETLEKIEADLPEDIPRRQERIRELTLACEASAYERWKEFYLIGNRVIQQIKDDQNTVNAVKRYTEKVLTPELMAGRNWHRSYLKPLGYPGDFEIMNFFYNLSLDGNSAFEKFCHQLGNSTGQFISNRMTMVKQAIARLADQSAQRGESSFEVASLGCGPAQEVSNYLKTQALPLPVNFTLIDQDHDALSCAYKNSFPEVSRLGGQAKVNCLHASFMEFLAAGKLFDKLGKQDLIYTVGLVDYLASKRANRFVKDLYANLNPGGTVIVGNMRHSETSLEWVLDYVTDWKLEYRTEAEMLAMTDGIDLAAKREVLVDITKDCYLLLLSKPL